MTGNQNPDCGRIKDVRLNQEDQEKTPHDKANEKKHLFIWKFTYKLIFYKICTMETEMERGIFGNWF